jgi:hypothetical protein
MKRNYQEISVKPKKLIMKNNESEINVKLIVENEEDN